VFLSGLNLKVRGEVLREGERRKENEVAGIIANIQENNRGVLMIVNLELIRDTTFYPHLPYYK
jgi:hypothetical protein